MNNIEQIQADIRNEIRIDSEGKATLSIRGATRLMGLKGASALIQVLKIGDQQKASKLAQRLMQQGFQVVSFPQTGIPDTALSIIAEYYAFDAQKTTEQARLVYRAFRENFNLKGGRFSGSKLVKTLMQYGFEVGAFSQNGVPDTAIPLKAKANKTI